MDGERAHDTDVASLCGRILDELELPDDAIALALDADRIEDVRNGFGLVRGQTTSEEARAPRRHACQPSASGRPADLRPRFVSLRYGAAGYGQLSASCPAAIGRGAHDGAEMGALHSRYQAQREASLCARLEEYLPIGLEAGLFIAG